MVDMRLPRLASLADPRLVDGATEICPTLSVSVGRPARARKRNTRPGRLHWLPPTYAFGEARRPFSGRAVARLSALLHLTAGDPMARPQFAQFWADALALCDRERAARVKHAAGRRVDRARHLADDRAKRAARLDRRIRHR